VLKLPQEIAITKAYISLYANSIYNNPYDTMTPNNGLKYCNLLESDWDEATVTYSYPWNIIGGDIGNLLSWNNNTAVKQWDDFDVTHAIQGVVAGTVPNYGFLIRFDSYSPAKATHLLLTLFI
jgi:hypothetical protein